MKMMIKALGLMFYRPYVAVLASVFIMGCAGKNAEEVLYVPLHADKWEQVAAQCTLQLATEPSTGTRVAQGMSAYKALYLENVGLLKSGNLALAKHHVDSVIALVEQYGFVPDPLGIPQVPYLAPMVRELNYFLGKQDDFPIDWLKRAFDALMKEYGFWTMALDPARKAETDAALARGDSLFIKLGIVPEQANADLLLNEYLAVYRVELHVLLHLAELHIGGVGKQLDLVDHKEWRNVANARKDRLFATCSDSLTGLYRDYDLRSKQLVGSGLRQSLYILYAGLLEPADANKALATLVGTYAKELVQADEATLLLAIIAFSNYRKTNYVEQLCQLLMDRMSTAPNRLSRMQAAGFLFANQLANIGQ